MACNFTTVKFAMVLFIAGELQFQGYKRI